MNKLALALILALTVALGYAIYMCIPWPWVQEKANWGVTMASDIIMPTYKNLSANPIFAPVIGLMSAAGGGLLAKFVYDGVRTQDKAVSDSQISGLTDNLIQTSGTASTLQTTNTSLLKQLEDVRAENTALKANDPTNHYETLLAQADKEIVRLRDNVSNLNTQIAQMKIAVKTVVA